ncbi:tetratricopeptide repeat-containing sensor histidine kinase [Odoribacter sp. OttesenSCG-928-L07]|nr:tetratricopeptide repeat-containing sensor histidine kinase [Odoribacter sp. OttesenSCG-928-L07]MDL2239621.1 tetratricopeptide repeat-containing sensor histidine kinase [Bacteroidales bacterium OttesenSCG-928-L14]
MRTFYNSISLIVVLMILGIGQLQAQSDKLLETEELVASGNLSDEEMYKKYDMLMWDYRFVNMDKSHYYFKEALAFAQKNNNVLEESKCLKSMGNIYDAWGNRDSVLFFLDQALELIDGKEDYLEEAHNYEIRGNHYLRMYNLENALDAYQKSLDLIEKDKLQKLSKKQNTNDALVREAFVSYNISNIYFYQYNYDRGCEQLFNIKKIMDDNPTVNFKSLAYIIPGSIADYYILKKQDDKALPFMEENYRLASENNAYSSMVYALNRLTNYYRVIDRELAFKYGKEALEIAEKTKIPYLLNLAEGTLARTYIHSGDYQAALYHTKRSLDRTEEDDLIGLENLYGDMVMIHALMGNRNDAEVFQEYYREILMKISDENLHSALQEMQVKYETSKKELEIENQKVEIERHKTLQIIYIVGLIMAALLLFLLVSVVRLRTKHNKELKEINATKDKFFNIISHDLKNPTIAQRNAMQLLAGNYKDWDEETLEEFLSELVKSTDIQLELIYDLLNWAQAQTGRMPFIPTTFDLEEALRADINIVNNAAKRKNIELIVDASDKLEVFGDKNMLVTVIRNLLNNAVKFTNDGGTVCLKMKLVDNGFEVIVEDTGVGMSAEQIENLFNLAEQHSNIGTAGEHGSGFGLIVCKEMIEKHGSTLKIESEIGKGSRVGFVINMA